MSTATTLVQGWELWPDEITGETVIFGPTVLALDSTPLYWTVYCCSPRCAREIPADGYHEMRREDRVLPAREEDQYWEQIWGDINPHEALRDIESWKDLPPEERARRIRDRYGDVIARGEELEREATGAISRLDALRVHATLEQRACVGLIMTVMVMAYLTQCDEYVVDVRPCSTPADRLHLTPAACADALPDSLARVAAH